MCDESMQPDAMTLHRLVKATSVLNARYINAMLAIAAEIKKVSDGIWPQDDNPLMNHPIPRRQSWLMTGRMPIAGNRLVRHRVTSSPIILPPIGRVDNAFGNRNLVCTCPPMEMWEDAAE